MWSLGIKHHFVTKGSPMPFSVERRRFGKRVE